MIFTKNPVLGKVKTRLAKSIGEDEALKTYRLLLKHTRDITQGLDCDKAVFYSDFINCEDMWNTEIFEKKKQTGKELGERLANAFSSQFDEGYQQCVVIGSDCYELTSEVIEKAFEVLAQKDVVIGPAEDGGYYLLGCSKMIPELFENKEWSTSTVFSDTVNDLNSLNIPFESLKTLSDVDEEKDLETITQAS